MGYFVEIGGGATVQVEECDAQGNPLQGQSQTIQTPFGSVTVRGLRATSAPISANIPVLKKTVDPAEQKLLDKLIPKFNGESKCTVKEHNKLLGGAPLLPWFGDGTDEVTLRSKKAIKRWTATNLASWPICRFERTPLELVFDRSYIGGDVYGGEFCDPSFYCKHCGGG